MKKKYIYIGGAILLALLLLLSGIAIGQSHSYNYSDKNYISEDYVSNSEYGDTYGDITAKSEEAPEASASDEGSLFSHRISFLLQSYSQTVSSCIAEASSTDGFFLFNSHSIHLKTWIQLV